MLKSVVVIVFAVFVVLTHAEPPPESHVQFKGQSNHYQNQHGNVKIRQSGPSKIFGWLGSRFAKIPHYLPRFPQFPKHAQHHKLPQYQASIIIPDPLKSGGAFYAGGKPEQVKITHLDESASYNDHSYFDGSSPSVSEIIDHGASYSPVPVSSVDSYSVPESVPQIEVVPSTLLYHNKQVYNSQPQPAAPIAAPPLQQQYNVVNDYRNQPSYASVNAIPASVSVKKPIATPVKAIVQNSNVPFVPHSTGPDYFDTAYRGANTYQQQNGILASSYQPQQQQQAVHQGLGTPENNYGATFEIQSQGLPQLYAASLNVGAVQQQATHYTAPSAGQNIQDYANQALNSQALSSLIASIPDSVPVNQQANVYANYNPIAAASIQQQHKQQQQQQQYASKSETPGVQILSQGTDGGNPVFEVLADHDAPQYEGGHPFDINKLISMIEPGAQLESAELSHAASESKTTYTVPAGAQHSSLSSASSTSGITDLLLSESEPFPSLSKVDGSKFTRQLLLNPLKSSTNQKNSSSSIKEIMDFFQQTGGKGYIVVEKKRKPDNLTLDSDPNRDDDLTNGPTRVNITSESFLPQLELELLNNKNNKPSSLHKQQHTSSSSSNDTLDNANSEDDRALLISVANPGDEDQYDEGYDNYNYDDSDYDSVGEDQSTGQNDKGRNSVKLNLVVPPPPTPSPQSLTTASPPPDKRQQPKTEQTIYHSNTSNTSSSGNRNNNDKTTPKTIVKTKSTTVKPTVRVTTQKSQLTTLFEPVTSGKPVVFTTTPEPFPHSPAHDTSNLHPNHNYFANPNPSVHSKTNSNYPPLGLLSGLVPTINPFLDTVDESVLDDPLETDEGDLSASESQQVRSIAITVTPPPKHVVTTTTKMASVIVSSSIPKNSKALGKGTTVTSSSSSSSSSNVGTATTTDKPMSTSTVSSSIVAPVTKKTTLTGYPNKTRPSPVYRGKTTPKP